MTTIEQLKAAYADIQKVTPTTGQKLIEMIKTMPSDFLEEVKDQDINFISMFAGLELINRERK